MLTDVGYQGADKRLDTMPCAKWHTVMCFGKRRALDNANAVDVVAEKLKVSVRAQVKHLFRVVKC